MQDVDVSFLDIPIDDAVEFQAVKPGEYLLLVEKAEIKEGDKGRFLKLTLSIAEPGYEDEPTKRVSEVLMLPNENDDKEQRNFKLLRFKQLYAALGVEGSQLDLSSIVGRNLSAVLKLESTEQWGEQNRVSRFMKFKA